jgi:hypothetical protein
MPGTNTHDVARQRAEFDLNLPELTEQDIPSAPEAAAGWAWNAAARLGLTLLNPTGARLHATLGAVFAAKMALDLQNAVALTAEAHENPMIRHPPLGQTPPEGEVVAVAVSFRAFVLADGVMLRIVTHQGNATVLLRVPVAAALAAGIRERGIDAGLLTPEGHVQEWVLL